MYTGHLGLALGAKGLRQQAPLWLLCTAALAPDLVDFSAQILGHDTSAATHTLPGMLCAAAVFFLVGWVTSRQLASGVTAALLAASHVPADLITSRLHLWPSGPIAGLHWYLHPLLDFSMEATIVFGGWLLYGRSLPARRRYAVASLTMLALLLALQGYMATLNIS